MTQEQAVKIAAEQTAELQARGATEIDLKVVFVGDACGWTVVGSCSLDRETDPVWGPVVEALEAHGA